jgi:DNA repair exonuclease SbcCD ATPase subunit
VALHAADPLGPETEALSFELDRFEVHGDGGLEVRGRWFGVRGRRFMRPTLTLHIDGSKHRLLADLEHKPWAAEDGEEWVASFSPAPPAGEADEIELAVAPDVAISLSGPGLPAPSSPSPRPASRRKREPDRAPRALEQERAKARDLVRALGEVESEHARLAAERDALVAERERMEGDFARLAAERDALVAERERMEGDFARLAAERGGSEGDVTRLAAERDALIAERESLRREQALARERVVELRGELRSMEASAKTSFSKLRERLKAERAETKRLRSALEKREAAVADRDRLARELDAVVAERDRLAAQASQPRTVAAEIRPAPVDVPARQTNRAVLRRRRHNVWVGRALAIVALGAVLLTVLLVLQGS